MQELGLPMSPGEGLFVTNEDEGVGKVGDGLVEAQNDVDEPEEYVRLSVGLSTKSTLGGHVKDSQPEMLLSSAVHDFERPRFGLTAARPFCTKSRSSMAASRLSIVGAFPIFDSNPAKGEEELFLTQSRQPRAHSQQLTSRARRPQRFAHTLLK